MPVMATRRSGGEWRPKREEVVFLPWRNLLQTAKGHWRVLEGEKWFGHRMGASNLQQRLVQ